MTGVTLPLAVLAGIISFISPCFLPIVPVYVGYMVGGQDEQPISRRATLLQACAFVGGFSAVFVTLWASIGLVGYALSDYRDLLRIAGGAVLIVMGLHVAGLIELSMLYRTARPIGAPSANGRPTLRRSGLLGLAFGAGWTPCIGPILGGVIGLASVSSTVGEGALLLVAYCLGLGLPFVLVAMGADALHRRMSALRRHTTAIALTSGAFLIVTGFLMVTNLFSRLSGSVPTFGL
ncbi:cytochrome c biogenesis CcdA family protein [Austwickia chelonae]|uniref:cytochrome c biogenesis CcdA family protein n=1 Tax=Austwickia chelonae TaxID=100225 RepID=UPI000E227118|nr:cytochrome c biogenesis protein CcdA [Austwickia chelonae]